MKLFYLLMLSITLSSFQIFDTETEVEVIKLKVGKTHKLTIGENGSTGYHWQYVKEKDCGINVSSTHKSKPNPKGMTGVGGYRTFVFKATEKGSCEIKLYNSRGGEDGAITTKILQFIVE